MQARRIAAVIFDLDNTLTDFMRAKDHAIRAAIDAMIDCGLSLRPDDAHRRIYTIYQDEGIEYQRVFDRFLKQQLGGVDHRMLAAAVMAYRTARDGSLVLYPHAKRILNHLLRGGYGLAVVSDAPRFEAWLRLCRLGLHHHFDHVFTYDDTGARKPDPVPFRMALAELERGARTGRDGRRLAVARHHRRPRSGHPHRLGALRRRLASLQGPGGGGRRAAPRRAAEFVVDDLSQLLDVLARLNGEES